jgi:hypothetical protein
MEDFGAAPQAAAARRPATRKNLGFWILDFGLSPRMV